jgi:hypothetical protein
MGGGQNPAALEPMNKENINPEDPPRRATQSSARCCASRAHPPCRRVSRKVSGGASRKPTPRSKSAGGITWLDALAALVLRPRLALATAAVLMVAGALLGVRDGNQMAHQDAQARYLAAVAPHSLR